MESSVSSLSSFSSVHDTQSLPLPSLKKRPTKSRSMFPLRGPSSTDVKGKSRPLRSLSGFLPSPESSDCDLSDREPLHALTPAPFKQRVGSTALPTPPTSDDETDRSPAAAEPTTPKKSALPKEFPFPRQPISLPSTRENTLPQTPTRRCLSANVRRKQASPYPDRFISKRSTPTTPQSPAETYRISKHPEQLLPEEKLLRHGSATPDPFSPLKVSRIRADRLNEVQRHRGSNDTQRSYSRTLGFTTVSEVAVDAMGIQNRQASIGSLWNVGGNAQATLPAPVRGVSNGRGGFLSSGSNAPMYDSHFLDDLSTDQDVDQMERRLAAALGIDRTLRVLENTTRLENSRVVSTGSVGIKRKHIFLEQHAAWKGGEWIQSGSGNVLDAPGLRDDYYCTVLAYCHRSNTLAVGLANRVYLWSEDYGVRYPPHETSSHHAHHVTTVAFSSDEGRHSILAVGRNNGTISLWSLYDAANIRFTSQQPHPIACVSFKPCTTKRPSEKFGSLVPTEELLVGDETGHIYYYAVEWMSQQQVDIHGWNGHMKLLARIEVHTQQICGLAWSVNGEFFCSGANDNACYLFETNEILKDPVQSELPRQNTHRPLQSIWDSFPLPNFLARNSTGTNPPQSPLSSNPLRDPLQLDHPFPPISSYLRQSTTIIPGQNGSVLITEGRQKHKWTHSAAIKAIAFCPWQRGLLATGGGSNDRAIHFYHIYSGACLATINVHAQVTSLIWSTSRREIAATFGYPQPDHPFRIAVFSWPKCEQVLAIPWGGDLRALFAVGFPGPSGEMVGRSWRDGKKARKVGRGKEEDGCIVVAGSDECVRFHEIWPAGTRGRAGEVKGGLGGSVILEGLDGGEGFGGEMIR